VRDSSSRNLSVRVASSSSIDRSGMNRGVMSSEIVRIESAINCSRKALQPASMSQQLRSL
jgi:hypothetical protein